MSNISYGNDLPPRYQDKIGAGEYEGSQDWLALSRKKFAQPNDEALREEVSDLRCSNDPGLEGTLAANMECEHFDALLDFIETKVKAAVLAGQIKELDSLPYVQIVAKNGNLVDVVRWQTIIERSGELLAEQQQLTKETE